MKNLVKLEVKNSWEYLTYEVNGQEVSNLKEVVAVLKGKKKKLKTNKTTRYSSYSDMGHVSHVNCPDYSVQLKNELGLPLELSLYELVNKKVKLFVNLKNVSFKKENV